MTYEKKQMISDLKPLLEQSSLEAVGALVADLHPADIADIIEALTENEKRLLFQALDARTASEVVVELSDFSRDQVLEGIHTQRLADIVDDMPSDEATDFIAELPAGQAAEVLRRIDLEDTEDVRTLLQYDEDSAGGIMQLELLSARVDQTVQDAIDAIRQAKDEAEDIYNVFVVDAQNRLVGTLPIFRLLLEKPDVVIESIFEPCPLIIKANEDQETVAHKFRHYDLVSAPVVDDDGHLLGRITIDDVMEVLEEETREDLLRMAGASSEEDMFYSNQIFRISRLRLPWLLTNMFGGLVTGYILWLFKLTVPEAVTLMSFVPVIMSMGGNVGIQSSTIMVRGFAVGAVNPSNILKMLFKEIRVAAVIGCTCGLAVGLLAQLWHGSYKLGVVVGFSMLGAIMSAALTGTIFPALFKRIGVDPAISSGPFVTTANDIIGVLIYFGIAAIFYRLLLW